MNTDGRFTKGHTRNIQVRFKKGHVPWHNGVKLADLGFPPPANSLPKGTVKACKNGKGYRNLINIHPLTGEYHKRWYIYSRYVLEQARGELLTAEDIVWHIDTDQLNDDIKNLEIITRAESCRRVNYIRFRGNYPRDLPDVV